MSRDLRKIFFLALIFIISNGTEVCAQKAAEVQRADQQTEQEMLLRQRIEKKKARTPIEEEPPAKGPVLISEEKVLIKKIEVGGVTLLSSEEIDGIAGPYQNKELKMRDMQKIADLITDAYRQKGYITSRAYLPAQKIENALLQIKIIEGITGSIEIKGNHYFKTSLYRNKIHLKKGDFFNFEDLRLGMSRINSFPDRNAKAFITPGKDAGSTDVLLEVKDRLPIHLGFDADNYGSQYINYYRFRSTFTHNNLLGFDDILTFQYQNAQAGNYKLAALRYLFPVTQSLNLGAFAADSRVSLRKDLKSLNARGKSRYYTFFASQDLLDKENKNLVLNFGFDYSDTFSFQQGNETSRDRMRVARLGLDWDGTDRWGRTIATNEFNYGIPNIMAGLKDKDSRASRVGSGGKFWRNNVNLLRLQKMPFNSALLWKNQMQYSPYTLTSAEQYQIGGIINVRAYPPAEMVGDCGYSMVWEWSFPPYFLTKKARVPLSKAKIYDALRFVFFYDWANIRLYKPLSTEKSSATLRGTGCGMRINLPEDFSARVEVAWALDQLPSDNHRVRTNFMVSKSF